MVLETGVQFQVESYQRHKKWYLMLNTQHYKVTIKSKVEQSREWSSTLPYTLLLKLLKREPLGHHVLRSPTLLTYIQAGIKYILFFIEPEASRKLRHTEELWYNETVYLYVTI